MPTPLAYFGYPLDAGSDGLGKPPELTDLLPVYGQDQYHRANQKAQRTTQLTPLSTRAYEMKAKPQCSRRRRDWHG